MSSMILTTTTNIGAQKKGEQLQYGRCWKLTHYQLGTAGHDPATNLPLVPDPTLSELPSPIQSSLIPIPAGSIYQVTPRITEIRIQLPENEAYPVISSLALFGTIFYTEASEDAALLGTQYMHVISHFSSISKQASESKTLVLALKNI
jgi:hypothetical protein